MIPQTSENALFYTILILTWQTFSLRLLRTLRVTAIIDSSNVRLFPKFYVATLPRGRYHFAVEDHPEGLD
jgi:hypothetical protein